MDDTDDVSLFLSSDCTDGTDEDPKYCGEQELSIWLCFLSHLLFLSTFLAFGCPSGQIRCVNPGSGPSCVFKTSMCDRAR